MNFPEARADAEISAALADIDRQHEHLRHRLTGPPSPWHATLQRLSVARSLQSTLALSGMSVPMPAAIDAVDGAQELFTSQDGAPLMAARAAFVFASEAARDPDLSFGRQLAKTLNFLFVSHDVSKSPGRFRPGYRATIASARPQPEASRVHPLMGEAMARYTTGAGHIVLRATLLRRAIWLIQPFMTANGRVGRCLHALMLARSALIDPAFLAPDESEMAERLTLAVDDPQAWIGPCVRAQNRQGKLVSRRIDEFSALWDAVSSLVAAERLGTRSALPLFEAALGVRLTNPRYMRLAAIETHTATRDFKMLSAAGLLVADGEKRGRSYRAAPRLAALRARTRIPRVAA